MAQELLEAVFPEMVRQELNVQILSFGQWPAHVDSLPEVSLHLLRPKTREEAEERVLEMLCAFDVRRRLARATFKGPYVRSDEMARMLAFARSHADSSDHELLVELKRRGARYGPQDVQEPPIGDYLTRLEPFVGQVTDRQTRFVIRQRNGEPRDFFFMDWAIALKTVLPDGSAGCYLLNVEPFAGRLTRLERC